MASINKLYGTRDDAVRKILLRNGVSRQAILDISNANRAQAKRELEARRLASKMARGRSLKLDEDKVRQIRVLMANRTKTHPQIANDFGVSVATIEAIGSGRNWGWVT